MDCVADVWMWDCLPKRLQELFPGKTPSRGRSWHQNIGIVAEGLMIQLPMWKLLETASLQLHTHTPPITYSSSHPIFSPTIISPNSLSYKRSKTTYKRSKHYIVSVFIYCYTTVNSGFRSLTGGPWRDPHLVASVLMGHRKVLLSRFHLRWGRKRTFSVDRRSTGSKKYLGNKPTFCYMCCWLQHAELSFII